MAVMRTLGMRHHARNLKQEAVTKPPDPGWNKKTERAACDLAWMCHLPNWCCFNPPPRIDSLNEGLDQLIDSGGDAENGVRTASRIPGHVEGLEAGVEVQDWGSHGPHT